MLVVSKSGKESGVLNHHSTMETETISKHGRNPKSIMSRNKRNTDISMKKLFVTTIVLAFLLSFASCKKECKCTYKQDGVKLEMIYSQDIVSKDECKVYNVFMKEDDVESKCVWQ